jgi:glucokinase
MKYSLGIDLGGTNIRGGILDASGQILFRDRKASNARKHKKGEEIAKEIFTFIRQLLKKSHLSLADIVKLGIGVPGTILQPLGMVGEAPHIPSLKHFPIREALEKTLCREIIVENDANCLALGEFHQGVGRGSKHLCLLALGTGVGGGIIIDGSLVRGKSGTAGELGHLVIEKDGPLCRCGNRGCLEAYCSSAGFGNILQSLGQAPSPAQEDDGYIDLAPFCGQAAAGDQLALTVFELMGTYLGVGLSSIINMLNPEVIVITGGLAKAWSFFAPAMLAEARVRAFQAPMNDVRIVRGTLGDDAGIMGTLYL